MALTAAEQLSLACNEQATEEALTALWEKSRSIKVRKAIAKNSNSSPQVLKAASRLYLEEVLENPGFLMLELFDNDTWIKEISECYLSPDTYTGRYSYYRSGSQQESTNQCYWACLLSPNLSPKALNEVIQRISSEKLKRALKNPKVVQKLKILYVKALKTTTEIWPFDLEALLVLHREGLINNDYLIEGLSHYGVASSSCRKATFLKFLRPVFETYKLNQDSETPRLLAKIFLISRAHMLHWVPSENCYSPGLLKWSGELYTKILRLMFNATGYKVLTTEHVKYVGGVVSKYLRARFIGEPSREGSTTPQALTQIYTFLKSYNLDGVNFSSLGLSLRGKESALALLKCDIKTKEFFTKTGCLGTWASATGSDPKYSIINEVNEYIYSQEGITNNLLFTSCSVRKIVSLENSTHIF